MAALLARFLPAVGWGSSDYAAGSASRRSSAVSVVILTHFAALVAVLYISIDFGPVLSMLGDVRDMVRTPDSAAGVRWSGPTISGSPSHVDVLWGLAAGLGGGFGAMLLFRGLGRGSMAVVAPITASGAASIPAVYGILGGETVTFFTVLGIGLALGAIVLLSLTGDSDATEPLGSAGGDDGPSVERTVPITDWDHWASTNPVEAERADVWLDSQLEGTVLVGGDRVPDAVPMTSRPTWPPPQSVPIEVTGSQTEPHQMGVSLRRIRATIIALTVAALLAAVIAAAGPIGSIVAGDPLLAGEVAALALAFVVIGTAVFSTHATRLLFQVRAVRPAHLERRTNPPSFDARSDRVERRTDLSTLGLASMLRQPGVPEALLSGVGFGVFFVFISRAAESAGYWPLVSARAISVVVFAAAALVTSTALLPERGSRRAVVVAGLLDAAAAVFFVLATRAGLLSVGAVLASLYPGVTVLFARFVGQERIHRQQLLGLALAAVAVSLLAI